MRRRTRARRPEPAASAGDRSTRVHPAGPRSPAFDSASAAGFDGVEVPYGLRLAAAWSWRLLLVGAVTAVVLYVVATLSVVVVPVAVSLLLASLAVPAVDRLTGWGLPRPLSTMLVLLAGLVAVVGLLTFVGQQVATGFGDLADSFNESLSRLQRTLRDMGLSQDQLQNAIDRVREQVSSGGNGSLSTGVLHATTTAGHVVAGFFIVLFATFFFMYDGGRIWSWLVRLLPRPAWQKVDVAGRSAWRVLQAYTRATVLVAVVDAVGIGLVALLLGLPLVAPIAALVFLGAFIPLVGAALSGLVAVAVALVASGPVVALLMLGGVVVVQQVEAHGLQPFLLGRSVSLHPLAVILVIAVGGLLAGIVGALVAVPIAAVANTVALHLSGRPDAAEPVVSGD